MFMVIPMIDFYGVKYIYTCIYMYNVSVHIYTYLRKLHYCGGGAGHPNISIASNKLKSLPIYIIIYTDKF